MGLLAEEAELQAAAAEAVTIALGRSQHHRLLPPGISLAVVRNGRTAIHACGVSDVKSGATCSERTVFRIASLTKLFTSTAVLTLHERGLLDLDVPAVIYLRELREIQPAAASAQITIRQLLSHSARLPRLGPWNYTSPVYELKEEEMLAQMSSIRLLSAPGKAGCYSNLGYQLLGLIVGRASGKTFQSYMLDSVFRPLGMMTTGWSRPSESTHQVATGYRIVASRLEATQDWLQGAAGASGGIYSTAQDMSLFLGLHLNAYSGGASSNVLSKISLAESHRISHDTTGTVARLLRRGRKGYGLGWKVTERNGLTLSHAGATAGYACAMLIRVADGIGACALTNLTDAPGLASRITAGAVEVLTRRSAR